MLLGPGLLSTTGIQHKRQRKLLNPVFSVAHLRDMVQIFYNMEGLSHKLKSVGIFRNPNEMAPFARAFSLNKSLFSFIDVGSGKERADHKVRGEVTFTFSYDTSG